MKVLVVPRLSKNSGFSLVEVIVFVSVLSVALVSLIASVAYSSLLLIDAQHKVIATRYSEEVAEWLKFQREYYTYDALSDQIPISGVATYCFNESGTLTWPGIVNISPCTDFTLDNYYARQVELTRSGSEITTVITTTWQTLGQTKSTQITAKYNDYGL